MGCPDRYIALLKRYWGYDGFRGIQREIIESICAGRDTLGLMPTGGGKSICFQVPALAMEGVCVVVSPLVALMKDQVARLYELGIKAVAVHSGMRRDQIVVALENCILGDYKILYVSPERLASELFLTKLRHMNVSFVCVDEAHCISQWGYDFRPSYLKLQQLRRMVDVPVLALTATATAAVIDDIQDKLGFRERNVFKMSFARPNLCYGVCGNTDTLSSIKRLLEQHEGSTIIYVNRREGARGCAELLVANGYRATFFHAGLSEVEKDVRQREWREGSVRIMVATSAFGMGIDKPDVRLVIHLGPPDSLEAYYQEAGRAGRDGKPAWAIMLYGDGDIKHLRASVDRNFPPKDAVRVFYDHLCYYMQIGVGSGLGVAREFRAMEFCRYFHHSLSEIGPMMSILELSGYVRFYDEDETVSRLQIVATRQQLYGSVHGKGEVLFNYILRRYSGVFRMYAYIDEDDISMQTGLAVREVYEILVGMTRIGVVNYIPRRRVAFVRLVRERVEGERLVIPREAYDDRRERYVERVSGVVSYLRERDVCRTRLLLQYFGESPDKDCGNCDNCESKVGSGIDDCAFDAIRDSILRQLADGPKFGYQLDLSAWSRGDVMLVVRTMTENGELRQSGLMLALT